MRFEAGGVLAVQPAAFSGAYAIATPPAAFALESLWRGPSYRGMDDRLERSGGLAPQPEPRLESHRARRWAAVTDWLGAQKPLNLIAGMIALIALLSVLAHLART